MPDLGEKDSKPSWVPLKKNPEFACSVMSGIDSSINSVNEEKFIQLILKLEEIGKMLNGLINYRKSKL